MRLPHGVYVAEYVRRLEGALIGICADLGLPTTRVPGRAGIWVTGGGRPDRKVAVVGTRVQQRVTMHGFALNCSVDLRAFDAIVPCGITDTGVTFLSKA